VGAPSGVMRGQFRFWARRMVVGSAFFATHIVECAACPWGCGWLSIEWVAINIIGDGPWWIIALQSL